MARGAWPFASAAACIDVVAAAINSSITTVNAEMSALSSGGESSMKATASTSADNAISNSARCAAGSNQV